MRELTIPRVRYSESWGSQLRGRCCHAPVVNLCLRAGLEIDEKFRGQTITCPDCNKPLPTVQPPRVPKKTSVFALASPLLALIGAFTLVGPVLAIVCGGWALRDRQIRRTARGPASCHGRHGFGIAL